MHSHQHFHTRSTKPSVGVIGLGYTGLPLALSFAIAGCPTLGFDIDGCKITALQRHTSYIPDVSDDRLAECRERFEATDDPARLAGLSHYVICVPTPIDDDQRADLRYVESAADRLAPYLSTGALVVLQSTVPPGTTAALAERMARASGLRLGDQLHVAVAPERVDPASAGGGGWTIQNTPKLISGVTPACTQVATELFRRVVNRPVPVSSPVVAETAKVFENTFRLVNIALAYELATLCTALGVCPREVMDAAGTKPYGFLRHYPGPGVGGECIPVDPLFLLQAATTLGTSMPMVQLAHDHVLNRPQHVVDQLTALLDEARSDVAGSRVLLVGAAYKPGVADIRNAPSVEIVRGLRAREAKVDYADPLVAELEVDGEAVPRVVLSPQTVANYDCVVLLSSEPQLRDQAFWDVPPLVLDAWQMLPRTDAVHHL